MNADIMLQILSMISGLSLFYMGLDWLALKDQSHIGEMITAYREWRLERKRVL